MKATQRAEQDIEDAWLFIARDSVAAAHRFLDRVWEANDLLTRFPGLGRRRPGLPPGLRAWPVGSWLLLYRVPDEGEPELVRVVSARRDLKRLFE